MIVSLAISRCLRFSSIASRRRIITGLTSFLENEFYQHSIQGEAISRVSSDAHFPSRQLLSYCVHMGRYSRKHFIGPRFSGEAWL